MSAVLLTGAGIIGPSGCSPEEHWQSVLAGTSHIGRISSDHFDVSSYPSTLGASVDDGFEPTQLLSGRMRKQTDRSTQFALVASDRALSAAELVPNPAGDYSIGVATASTGGAVEFGQRELQNLWGKGKEYVSTYQSYAWFYAVNTGQISIRHSLKGPSCVLVADHAGGLDVFGKVKQMVAAGCRSVLIGGVDGPLCPWAWSPLIASGQLTVSSDPATAYQPFTHSATGSVLGEGGAILVAETEQSWRERGGPTPLGELAGTASGFAVDPLSPTAYAATIALSLERAGLSANDIDAVVADAAGTVDLDASERDALQIVFAGAQQVPPVTAPKAGFGRLLAGAGAVDVLTACQMIAENVIPPTPFASEVIDGLPLAREAISTRVDAVLVLGRSAQGFLSSAVVTRPRLTT